VGSASLEATVFDTGGYCFYLLPCEPGFHYQTVNIGSVDLSEAAEYKLTIRPASRVGHNLMYFKSIELIPEKTPVPLS
jgi:hypothetical protein